MNLLDSAFEDFTILDKATKEDGYGGTKSEYSDGATIRGGLVLDNSMESRLAQKQGVTSVYTLTTRKSVDLDYHTVLRRNIDGSIFRVTSDGTDKKTPESSNLDMRQVNLEKWELPNG